MWNKVVIFCLLTFLLSITSISLAEQIASSGIANRPAILFIQRFEEECSHKLALRLQKDGYNIDVLHSGLRNVPLTWDRAKKFNVIVVNSMGLSNADGSLTKNNQTTIDTLNRFMKEGGGLLFMPNWIQMMTQLPPQHGFLKPLGMDILFNELTTDLDSRVATAWRLSFAYTDNIMQSPISEGVKQLWYPVPDRIGSQNHNFSMKYSAPWKTAVAGSATSFTRSAKDMIHAPREPGQFNKNVPLVAMREVGAGRIVCIGITQEYITGFRAETTLEDIVMERGIDGQQSDGAKIFSNSIKWLAESSATSVTLGGAAQNQKMLKNPYKKDFCKPYNWKKSTQPAEQADFSGMIGARTSYSSGSADVDTWVAAAKDAGLDFLVFLEEFAELSSDELKSLMQDCERLSTPDFAVLPGFTIDDEVGNHYYYFAKALSYPDKQTLSPDEKVFRSYDAALDKDNPHLPGQLSMSVLHYTNGKSGHHLTAGNYLFNSDAAPFADFFANHDSMGVITTKDGVLVEDVRSDYHKLIDSGQTPIPLVISLMSSPKFLKNMKWRTVVKVPVEDKAPADTVRGTLSNFQFYPANPAKVSISSGPRITTWGYEGPRDYEGFNADDFTWENYRWKLKGEIQSEAMLMEVRVYDGPKMIRRFLPNDTKTFTVELDITHDCQHNLTLWARDALGGEVTSGEQFDRNHRLEEFMCTDRNNPLSYGMVFRKDGTYLQLGGNQSLSTPYKRIINNISPSGTFKTDPRLGAPAFDGAATGEPEVQHNIAILSGGQRIAMPNVCENKRLFHSGDVNMGEAQMEHKFTDNIRVANVWHTLWRTEPAEDFTVKYRNHFFQLDPDSPLAVFLWQYDITLKKDMDIDSIDICRMRTGLDKLWVVRSSKTDVLFGAWENTPISKKRRLKLPFNRGAYVAMLDSPLGSGAIYSLTDGLNLSTRLPTRSNMFIDLEKEYAPSKAGESVHVELLLLGIPRSTSISGNLPSTSSEVTETFYKQLGLDGGSVDYKVNLETGEIQSQRYLCKINASKKQCLSGKFSGKLISALPVVADGLNDNWSAMLFDRSIGKARPLGVFEGKAWATLKMNGEHDLFIGHPIVANNSALIIQLTQSGLKSWNLEIHNPTDQSIDAIATPNQFFDPLRGIHPVKEKLAPGTSTKRTLTTETI